MAVASHSQLYHTVPVGGGIDVPMTDSKGKPFTKKTLRRAMEKKKQTDPLFAARMRRFSKQDKKLIFKLTFAFVTLCDSEDDARAALGAYRAKQTEAPRPENAAAENMAGGADHASD